MKSIILNRNYVKPLPLYKDRQEFVKAKEEHMLTFDEVFIGLWWLTLVTSIATTP